MLNYTPLTMESTDEEWTAALKLLRVDKLLAGLAAIAVSQNAGVDETEDEHTSNEVAA